MNQEPETLHDSTAPEASVAHETYRGLCLVAPLILGVDAESATVGDLTETWGLDWDDIDYGVLRETITLSKHGIATVTARGRAQAVASALVCAGPQSAMQISERVGFPRPGPIFVGGRVLPLAEVEDKLAELVRLRLVKVLDLRSKWPIYSVTDLGWSTFTSFSKDEWQGPWGDRPHNNRVMMVGPRNVETEGTAMIPGTLLARLSENACDLSLSLDSYCAQAIMVGAALRNRAEEAAARNDLVRRDREMPVCLTLRLPERLVSGERNRRSTALWLTLGDRCLSSARAAFDDLTEIEAKERVAAAALADLRMG